MQSTRSIFEMCTTNSIEYANATIYNLPINMNFVTTFRKSIKRIQPDNIGIPSIVFTFSNGSEIEWLLSKKLLKLQNYIIS